MPGLIAATTGLFIDLYGGRVWVDSTLGKGPVFSLALPVASNDQP